MSRCARKEKETAAGIELDRAAEAYTRAERRWRDHEAYDYFADRPPWLIRARRRKEKALLNYRATHKKVYVWLYKKPEKRAGWYMKFPKGAYPAEAKCMEVGKSTTKGELRGLLVEAIIKIDVGADTKLIRIGRWLEL